MILETVDIGNIEGESLLLIFNSSLRSRVLVLGHIIRSPEILSNLLEIGVFGENVTPT